MLDQIIIRKGDFSFPKWLLFSNHGMQLPANDNDKFSGGVEKLEKFIASFEKSIIWSRLFSKEYLDFLDKDND